MSSWPKALINLCPQFDCADQDGAASKQMKQEARVWTRPTIIEHLNSIEDRTAYHGE